jgi:hypothetical protein
MFGTHGPQGGLQEEPGGLVWPIVVNFSVLWSAFDWERLRWFDGLFFVQKTEVR